MTDVIKCIYMGREETRTGKLAARILPVPLLDKCKTPEDADDLCSLFEIKRSFKTRAIGQVYDVDGTVDDTGRIKSAAVATMRFSGDGANVAAAWVARWEAHDDAVMTAARARKIEADVKSQSALVAALRTVRQRYTSTDRIGRLALEVVVLDILRNN